MIEFAPRSKNSMTYEEAILYCQFLEYNGHSDWRMATREEWDSKYDIVGWFVDRPSEGLLTISPVRDVMV